MRAVRVMVLTSIATLGAMGVVSGAQIRETFNGTNGKRVYILEDIHGHYAVQKSHLETVGTLVSQESLRLILTEGSTGYVSSLPLQNQNLPSSLRLAAANTLLIENKINAAVVLSGVAG